MSDAWNAAKGLVTPKKGKAATPRMGDPNVQWDPRSGTNASEQSMMAQQRNPLHYQAGAEMSPALQAIHDRGQQRGDMAQGHLASAANFASYYGGKGYNFGESAAAQGAGASAYGQHQGAQLAAAGGQGGAIGNQYGQALAAQGGKASDAVAPGMGQASNAYGAAMGAANRLSGLESSQGPSAAQAQLRSGLNQAQGANLAAMRSGGGFGGNASATSQALRTNASMGQQAANQSAILKAGEDAAWRQRQASNQAAAGGLYGQAGNLGLGQAQTGLAANAQAMQGLGQGGEMALAGNAQNIGAMQAGAQTGLQGQAMGMQGAGMGMQGAGLGVQSMQAAGNLAAQGYGLGFQGDTQAGQAIAQDQAAKQAYENMLTQQMGIQSGVSVANAQSANAFTGGLISAAAGAGGMMAMSDERQKVKLSSGTRGNPYGARGAPGRDFQREAARDLLSGGAAQMAGSGRYGLAVPAVQSPGAFALSDERQKDFRDVKNERYIYKDPTLPGAVPGEQVGPMAQDIEIEHPEAIAETPNGKMVDQSRLVLPLSGAVGDLQRKMDRLEGLLSKDNARKTAENSTTPKLDRLLSGPTQMASEWEDDRAVADAVYQEKARAAAHEDAKAQGDKIALYESAPVVPDNRPKPKAQQFREAVGTFAREFGPTAVDTAALPVTLGARAASGLHKLEKQYPAMIPLTGALTLPARGIASALGTSLDEVANQSAQEAAGDVAYLTHGMSPAEYREKVRAEREEYPTAAMLGREAGILAGGAPAGALLGKAIGGAAPAIESALPALGEGEFAARTATQLASSPAGKLASSPLRTGAHLGLKESLEEVPALQEQAYLGGKDLTGSDIASSAGKALLRVGAMGVGSRALGGLLNSKKTQRAASVANEVADEPVAAPAPKKAPPKIEMAATSPVSAPPAPAPAPKVAAEGKSPYGEQWFEKKPKPLTNDPFAMNLNHANAGIGSTSKRAEDAARFLQSDPDYEELNEYVGSGYMKLNSDLRRDARDSARGVPTGGIGKKTRERGIRLHGLLDSAERAGHTVTGTTYRGVAVPREVLDEWMERRAIENRSFWSTSADPKTAMGFAEDNAVNATSKKHVILRLQGKSGVPIGHSSMNQMGEDEVLFNRGKKWLIRGVDEWRNGETIIDLEEVDEFPPGTNPALSDNRGGKYAAARMG